MMQLVEANYSLGLCRDPTSWLVDSRYREVIIIVVNLERGERRGRGFASLLGGACARYLSPPWRDLRRSQPRNSLGLMPRCGTTSLVVGTAREPSRERSQRS